MATVAWNGPLSVLPKPCFQAGVHKAARLSGEKAFRGPAPVSSIPKMQVWSPELCSGQRSMNTLTL